MIKVLFEKRGGVSAGKKHARDQTVVKDEGGDAQCSAKRSKDVKTVDKLAGANLSISRTHRSSIISHP